MRLGLARSPPSLDDATPCSGANPLDDPSNLSIQMRGPPTLSVALDRCTAFYNHLFHVTQSPFWEGQWCGERKWRTANWWRKVVRLTCIIRARNMDKGWVGGWADSETEWNWVVVRCEWSRILFVMCMRSKDGLMLFIITWRIMWKDIVESKLEISFREILAKLGVIRKDRKERKFLIKSLDLYAWTKYFRVNLTVYIFTSFE